MQKTDNYNLINEKNFKNNHSFRLYAISSYIDSKKEK